MYSTEERCTKISEELRRLSGWRWDTPNPSLPVKLANLIKELDHLTDTAEVLYDEMAGLG